MQKHFTLRLQKYLHILIEIQCTFEILCNILEH